MSWLLSPVGLEHGTQMLYLELMATLRFSDPQLGPTGRDDGGLCETRTRQSKTVVRAVGCSVPARAAALGVQMATVAAMVGHNWSEAGGVAQAAASRIGRGSCRGRRNGECRRVDSARCRTLVVRGMSVVRQPSRRTSLGVSRRR